MAFYFSAQEIDRCDRCHKVGLMGVQLQVTGRSYSDKQYIELCSKCLQKIQAADLERQKGCEET